MFRKKKKNINLLVFLLLGLIFFLIIITITTPRLITNTFTDLRIQSCQPKFDTHEKNYLLKINNLLEGLKLFLINGCDYPELKIDIRFKHLIELRKIRNEALKKNVILSEKKKYFPAKIYFNNKEYRADIKLKGVRIDHIYQDKQWSFKVKLKDNKFIKGMKEFSITKFSSRQFPDSVFFSDYLKRYNLKTPNFYTFKIDFNGDNWGPMLIEEHYSKSYKEKKKLRDIPIMTYSDGSFLEIYSAYESIFKNDFPEQVGEFLGLIHHKRKILTQSFNLKRYIKKGDINSFNLISFAKTIHEVSLVDKIKFENNFEKFLDIDQMALLIAYNLIWGEAHSLGDDNFRVYIDPFSGIIKYIPTDHMADMVEIENLNSVVELLNSLHHFSLLLNNTELKSKYLTYLNLLEQDLLNQDQLINNICSRYINYCKNRIKIENAKKNISLLKDYKFEIFKENKKKFFDLSKFTFNELSSLQETYNEFNYQDLSVRIFDDGILEIYNLTPFDIVINEVIIADDYKTLGNKCNDHNLKIQKKIERSLTEKFNKISINLNNKFCIMQKATIKTTSTNKRNKISTHVESSNYKLKYYNTNDPEKFSSIFKVKDNEIIVNSGKIIIEEPIIIRNKNLLIKKGVELIFKKNAYIYIMDGNLRIMGAKNHPVTLKAFEDNWGGIYVANSKKSNINYTNIFNTDYFIHKNIMLTGGLNFYNSNIDILNSNLIGSKAEDSINFVNSKFNFNSTSISNTSSDGIDSDFSSGEIVDSEFEKIIGDGIDLSGSNILIRNTSLSLIGDKAISIGEKSNVEVHNLNISNSRYGIANKDESKLQGTKIKILNSTDYDILAFTKKPYYSSSTLKLNDVEYDIKKSIIQTGHQGKINNLNLNTQNIDVKLLYE
tara:strand:- start:1514 stop:4174 length:2661 start_codon:yes stop_codon:yes gene_type:complete